MGVDSTLVARRSAILRSFDADISKNLMSEMSDAGQNVQYNTTPKSITKESDGTFTFHGHKEGEGDIELKGFEKVLFAVGRHPLTSKLGLGKAGIK